MSDENKYVRASGLRIDKQEDRLRLEEQTRLDGGRADWRGHIRIVKPYTAQHGRRGRMRGTGVSNPRRAG